MELQTEIRQVDIEWITAFREIKAKVQELEKQIVDQQRVIKELQEKLIEKENTITINHTIYFLLNELTEKVDSEITYGKRKFDMVGINPSNSKKARNI